MKLSKTKKYVVRIISCWPNIFKNWRGFKNSENGSRIVFGLESRNSEIFVRCVCACMCCVCCVYVIVYMYVCQRVHVREEQLIGFELNAVFT